MANCCVVISRLCLGSIDFIFQQYFFCVCACVYTLHMHISKEKAIYQVIVILCMKMCVYLELPSDYVRVEKKCVIINKPNMRSTYPTYCQSYQNN